MIPDHIVLLRLIAIMVLAGLIGLEREFHRRPAGLRTNVMVGIGSTLVTMASIQTVDIWPEARPIDLRRVWRHSSSAVSASSAPASSCAIPTSARWSD